MDTLASQHWHHLQQDDIPKHLETDGARGLEQVEVGRRQKHFGANSLTQKKGKSPLLLFLLQFHQPLVYILLGATVVTLTLREWVDGGVIFGVVLVNAAIGFIQESKALRAIEALAREMEGTTTVVRAGSKEKIDVAELVPGDLVLLQSGDKVPADLRLLRSRELQVDESSLTGESVPVQKQPESLSQNTALVDRSNMVYSSTLVTYGTGAGLVVAIGDGTEIGRINSLIASAVMLSTPLTRKIAEFSRVLLWIILGLAGLTLLAGWLHGESVLDSFMAAVALAVGAIPEGLPAAMTIMLAIGVSKMARRHAIIRTMPAVETLGSTTVICSDKTGTLTQNQMTVQQVAAGGELFNFTGIGYATQGEILQNELSVDPKAHPALLECLKAGLLCNDSQLVADGEQGKVEGDPTEAALIVAATKAGLKRDTLEQDQPRLDELPFESEYQYMATMHDAGASGAPVIYVKGSVESVLARCCDTYSADGAVGDLDAAIIESEVEEMAEKGLRVLALARKNLVAPGDSVTHANISDGLTFLGLQAMMDPPREEAIAAVEACHKAGIQVKMVTGDHLITAAAIARQIGLKSFGDSDPDRFAVGGQTLAQLADDELMEVAERATVFARVSPEQKLRLVEALQANEHVVAMTGDGVNDAPALKQADIGIAMGVGGTEVAREAADMVLTDDNFSSIELAVEEGRAVFDNLVKFIIWTLPTSIGEGLVILVAVFAGFTLPITPVQILWVNMTTTVLLGLMLAFEGKEPGIMDRPPRRPDAPILTRELVVRIGIVGLMLLLGSFGLFEWVLQQGKSIESARTATVNMLIFGELFYLFNCRSLRYSMFKLGIFSNWRLALGVVAMALLQVWFTYSSTMNQLFGSAPMGLSEWGWVVVAGLTIYAVVGIEKSLRYRVSMSHKPV